MKSFALDISDTVALTVAMMMVFTKSAAVRDKIFLSSVYLVSLLLRKQYNFFIKDPLYPLSRKSLESQN